MVVPNVWLRGRVVPALVSEVNGLNQLSAFLVKMSFYFFMHYYKRTDAYQDKYNVKN